MSEERASRVTSTQSVSSNTAEELNRAEDLKTRGAIYPRPEGLGFLASKDKYLEMDITERIPYTCGECKYCLNEDWIRCSVFELSLGPDDLEND